MNHLQALLSRYERDEQFRRLAIGNPIFAEMVAEAILRDRTGEDWRLTLHNAPGVDVVAADGRGVQVKTLGTEKSLAAINAGRDQAALVMVITTYGPCPRFFLMPMADFKRLALPYDAMGRSLAAGQQAQRWELRPSHIRQGRLNAFELEIAQGETPLSGRLSGL